MRRVWSFIIVISLYFVFSGISWGQGVYGSIAGTVQDSSGGAIPDAKVTITNIGQGVSVTATTNRSGNYEQTHLINGTYRVQIEHSGFKMHVQDVEVTLNSVAQVNASLEVGSINQTVTVTTNTVPVLETQRTDISHNLDETAVTNLPVYGRNWSSLLFLSPGTQSTGIPAPQENAMQSFRFSVNGQFFSGTTYQLDGVDNKDWVIGLLIIVPNLDGISETKVITESYDAEYGTAAAGVMTALTKSGTNAFHGSAFWYRRNSDLTARDPFAQSQLLPGTNRIIPPTLWNQFGGSLGGPIRKDKTFFFGDYQATRQKNGGSATTRVPTLAERNGDMSDLGVAVYNPFGPGGGIISPNQRNQFPNNTIPTSMLSPQALNLINLMPLPNLPVSGAAPNYAASGEQIINSNAFDVRIDQYQTEKLHMFGRYSWQKYFTEQPGLFGLEAGGPSFGNFNAAGMSNMFNQQVVYGFDYAVTPTLLDDFRFGFTRMNYNVNPIGLGTTPATDAGIPGLNISDLSSGMPNFRVNGTGGFQLGYSLTTNGCNCPLNERENIFEFVDDVNKMSGNHNWKFGTDIHYLQNLRVPSDSHRAGELQFDPTVTEGPSGSGLGLATFLLGQTDAFTRYVSSVNNAAERQNRWAFYGQDSWRVTPKFTLNYGLRWEIYDPQSVNGAGKGAWVSLNTGEVLVAGQNGIGLNGNIKNNLSYFGPRLGIAYQVTPKTVVRAGYGWNYDSGVFGSDFGHAVTQNLPVLGQQTLTPSQPWQDVFTLTQGPPSLNPSTILEGQPKGATGNPLLPNGITANVLPPTVRLPAIQSWNATVQRQFGSSASVQVAYVGNKATHTYNDTSPNYNVNSPSLVGFGTLSTFQRDPFYQSYGWTQSLKYFGDDSTNHYNAIQVEFQKNFSAGATIQATYTHAAAYDYNTDYYLYDPSVSYGPSSTVRNDSFTLSHVYNLPFGKGQKWFANASRAENYLVGGWMVSGSWIAESGLPFTPSYQNCGADEDVGVCRPNIVGNATLSNPSANGWFVTTGNQQLNTNGQSVGPWQRPQSGTLGNAGRDSLIGPGFFNADVSAGKGFALTERVNVQFRADIFNIFNHVNLAQPNACVDCPTGGQIFSLLNNGLIRMRQAQFALHVTF
ncbi:MAG TPA: TonB-dependent receptor [Bryobacteraceae bacterium]|nr:TonB-dependent receptor [Bryobacteraceae bacterium]